MISKVRALQTHDETQTDTTINITTTHTGMVKTKKVKLGKLNLDAAK